MRTELPMRITDTVLLGIRELDLKKDIIDTQRKAQIEELVLALAFKEKNSERTLSLISEIKLNPGHVGVEEKICACKKFISVFEEADIYKKEITSRMPGKRRGYLVGMLQNTYSDQVFFKLQSNFSAQALNFGSFEEMCESIFSGECDFGILPTESSDNGKLLRFYSLMDRYDLKINAVLDEENSDSSATTRYAIVSRYIEYGKDRFGTPDLFEFSVNPGDPQLLGKILYAADLCGMSLRRIDSLPVPYKDNEFLFCPVFDINGADIDAFLLYMYIDFPQYTPIGIFPKL
ncbi:MAG: hypothetical protein E7640_02550 [Ruminococcaceae bacterium]|nr:hypothetical protein [Oscillospiraceae bacterium]